MKGAEQDWLLATLMDERKAGDIFVLESTLPEASRFADVITDRQRFFHSIYNVGYVLRRILTYPESAQRRIFPCRRFRFRICL